MPIDYQPSRDLAPRWGSKRPPIEVLDSWFFSCKENYHKLLNEIRLDAKNLENIPIHFSEKNLPLPAWVGVPYSPFDAIILNELIKKNQPKRFLEIGSGISTCFAKKAFDDFNINTEIISIDPEPRAEIDSICDLVLRKGLENCDLSIFDNLESGDILFFDGSHRCFMNSDVTIFFIDVLPKIKPGVLIHIHDISLPYDYPEWAINWYWNEQYMLAVYLMGNKDKIIPIAPTSFLCQNPEFAEHFKKPFLDLSEQVCWTGGGAMWFTHK